MDQDALDYKEYFKGENQFDYVDTEKFKAENGSEITVKYSVTTKKFRDAAIGSGNKLNTFVGKNDGVSVVRNGRELELEKTFLTIMNLMRFICLLRKSVEFMLTVLIRRILFPKT